jgi:hypothetical protein
MNHQYTFIQRLGRFSVTLSVIKDNEIMHNVSRLWML